MLYNPEKKIEGVYTYMLNGPKKTQQLNKRSMGHIAHMRNQFKSINTFEKSYDYIITLIRRGQNP